MGALAPAQHILTPHHGPLHGGGGGLQCVNRRKGATRGQQETDQGQPTQRPQEHRAEDGSRQGRVVGQPLAGLTAASDVLLQDESADAFEARQRDVLADLAPQDALQAMLARRIVQLLWRLDRAARLEAELFLHGELAAKRDRLRAAGRGGAVRAAFERVYADQGGEDADALSKAMDERDRATDERRRAILAVDAEILLGAPSAQILVEREESARAFDRLARYEATLQRSLNRTLAEFRSLKREAVAQAEAEAEATADGGDGGRGGGRRGVAAGPGGRNGFFAKRSQSGARHRRAALPQRPPARRQGR